MSPEITELVDRRWSEYGLESVLRSADRPSIRLRVVAPMLRAA